MRILLAISLSAVFFLPQAAAVVDPDPDGVGIYFDLNADIVHTWVDPSVVFNAHVILTNPSATELQAFEYFYDLIPPPGMEGMVFRLNYWFPDCFNCIFFFEKEVVVGLPVPVPLANPHVLMNLQYLLLAPLEAQFFLGPTSGEPGTSGLLAYWSEAGVIPMNPSCGNPDLPVAMVNGEEVVPIEKSTLGSLKALFR